MVQLDEIQDEEFAKHQPGPDDDEADWDTDSASDTSSIASDDDFADESILDRIAALKDVVPPAQRRRLGSTISTTREWSWWGLQWAGRSLWVLSASMLLVGVPWALASTEDQQIALEEKQMTAQQQANDVLAPGAKSTIPGQPL